MENKCIALKQSEKIGIAVRKGKFQAQRIVFAPNGTSSIHPLTDWVSAAEACAVAKANGFSPYWERCPEPAV